MSTQPTGICHNTRRRVYIHEKHSTTIDRPHTTCRCRNITDSLTLTPRSTEECSTTTTGHGTSKTYMFICFITNNTECVRKTRMRPVSCITPYSRRLSWTFWTYPRRHGKRHNWCSRWRRSHRADKEDIIADYSAIPGPSLMDCLLNPIVNFL